MSPTRCVLSMLLVLVTPLGAATAVPPSDPGIALSVLDASGAEIAPGDSVTGRVTMRVEIHDRVGQHAQFYGNFVVLPTQEQGHMVDASPWVRTVEVDTARFYDGENLLSIHVHPHTHAGHAYSIDFDIGTFPVVTANDHPAPNGDVLLPSMTLAADAFTLQSSSTQGWSITGDARVDDDFFQGMAVERSQNGSGPIQVIPHLGNSVLGRFRWHSLTPPFGDQQLIQGASLRPFQTAAPRDARMVLFFTDSVGRANYAFHHFTIPALGSGDREAFPLPGLRAETIGIHQGDTLRVPADGSTAIQVRIRDPLPAATSFPQMTTWVGNRVVAVTDIRAQAESLPPGTTEMVVEVAIPGSEIVKLERSRHGGHASSAFALWHDFNNGNRRNVPNADHLHLTSIRTTDLDWPIGDPVAYIDRPLDGHTQVGSSLSLRLNADGALPAGARGRLSVDQRPALLLASDAGEVLVEDLDRSTHHIAWTLTDADGVPLPDVTPDAITVHVVNDPPRPQPDFHAVDDGDTLEVPAAAGLLANDSDLEGDPLTVDIVAGPTHGSLVAASDGSFSYTPEPGFSGLDVASYVVSDGFDVSGPTRLAILVRPPQPVAGLIGDWTMFGRDAAHTAHVPGHLGRRRAALSWSTPLGDDAVTQAVIAGGRLFISVGYYFDTLAIHALDATSGGGIWTRSYDGTFSLNPPAWADGRVFVQNGKSTGSSSNPLPSQLSALDDRDGSVVWTAPVAAQWERYLAPTISDGRVYVNGGYYGGMYGFDQHSGSELFWQSRAQYDEWTPTVADGRLFSWVAGSFTEHDPVTGEVVATLSLGWNWSGYDMRTAAVIDDGVALLRGNGVLHAVDLTTFEELWRLDGGFRGTPALADGLAYIGRDDQLVVLDARDGTELRSAAIGPIDNQPIVTDDAVIAAGGTATWICDRTSLAVLQELPYGGFLSLADNALYISSSRAQTLARYDLAADNQAPIAVIAADPTGGSAPLAVHLDAGGSSDPDGDPLHYRWLLPDGSVVDGSEASFTADEPGSLTVALEVRDGYGGYDRASTTIVVSSAAIAVNFQPAASATVAGYAVDSGAVFGPRGNGLSYGWNEPTDATRDRGATTDQLRDTLNHLMKGGPRTWEIAVPNGTYRVALVCGDPSYTDQVNHLVVEGTDLRDPDGMDHFDDYEVELAVSDGRLTIAPAGDATNAKLCAAVITPLVPSGNRPPVAVISADAVVGTAPLSVTLEAGASSDPDGDPLSYRWSLPDGSEPTGISTSFTADAAGSYIVGLEVSDGRGGVAHDTITLTATVSGWAVNFQPANSPVVDGYLVDSGAAFGARGAGLEYGWDSANGETRDRNVDPDQLVDTLNHLMKGPAHRWEFALPAGTYRVDLGCGDPAYTDQVNHLMVEGIEIRDPDGQDHFDDYEVTVTVDDGRLTIAPASDALNAKLGSVVIVPVQTVDN